MDNSHSLGVVSFAHVELWRLEDGKEHEADDEFEE